MNIKLINTHLAINAYLQRIFFYFSSRKKRMLYVERQSGGECRRHALNAFFGGGVLSWGDIETHSVGFERFYNLPSTQKMRQDYDFFNADGSSLLTWIAQLLDHDHFFLVVPCGHIHKWMEYMKIKDLDHFLEDSRIMAFNSDHVFAMRKQHGVWYMLDSMNPSPYPHPVASMLRDPRLGMVVSLVPNQVAELAFRLEQNIVTFLNRFSKLHTETVATFLNQGTLGDVGEMLEIWSQTRLRMLAFLRSSTSRTSRVYNHVHQMHKYPNAKEDNKKLLTYSVVLS